MRATNRHHPSIALSKAARILAAAVLTVSLFGGTTSAADSRAYSVSLSTPTSVSAGGATKIDIDVVSTDNQTIANMHLSVPQLGGPALPAGVTVTAVFGADAFRCSPPTTAGLSCNLGNFAGLGERHLSILVSVPASWTGGALTITASAETNNENGQNLQVEDADTSVTPSAFSANGITTYNLTGPAGTSPLGSPGAGNLRTQVNLLLNNGGVGNAIAIVEGTTTSQPSYCVTLKLTCQLDFADVTVNGGAAVTPYLETTLTATVTNKYSLKKAFVIHVLANGNVETGFPIYNVPASTCAGHPNLVPCADFSQAGNVVTIVVHTFGNGKFGF